MKIYLVNWVHFDWTPSKPFSTLDKAIEFCKKLNSEATIAEFEVDDMNPDNRDGDNVIFYE